MKLIVGLGNPGEKYKDTRHNIGWQTVDYLRDAWTLTTWDEKLKFKSHISKGSIDGIEVMLAKPQTFMNNSGEAVQSISSYFDIAPKDIWIIHDELDLPFRTFKLQSERGAAGHNGVASVIEKLGTNVINRIRIGISPSAEKRPQNSHGFVLKKFSFFERRKRLKLFEELRNSLEQELR